LVHSFRHNNGGCIIVQQFLVEAKKLEVMGLNDTMAERSKVIDIIYVSSTMLPTLQEDLQGCDFGFTNS